MSTKAGCRRLHAALMPAACAGLINEACFRINQSVTIAHLNPNASKQDYAAHSGVQILVSLVATNCHCYNMASAAETRI